MSYPVTPAGMYREEVLGEDTPVSFGDPTDIAAGTTDRGIRLGGGAYSPVDPYGRPVEYIDRYGRAERYGRAGPGAGYGGEYYGAPEYATERLERPGYGRQGYGQGYPLQQPPQVIYVQEPPPVVYVEPQESDLGMGLRDSHLVASTDYGAGYGRAEGGSGPVDGYYDGEKERLREELEHERRRKHQAEAVAAAAVGYGLYERHEKHEAEEELEKYEPEKEKKHHGLFGRH